MTERSIVARLRAEIAGFKGPMLEAAASVRGVGDEAERSQGRVGRALGTIDRAAKSNEKAWSSTAQTAQRGATAVGLGLVFAGKAAIDWESAWTGVAKTVDGTSAQMAEMEGALRGLTRELPATHAEIAGVAEAAGQLGVKRGDILGFTETMVKLGESTNLTAVDAATGIAQISNVMGTMDREGTAGVQRFGAALVALGNAGASTESQILDMASRLAGAGKLVGASEADVLALANAMASVGIESQLGGGVMSRVMIQMNSAVLSGTDSVLKFASVAGMSAERFSSMWRERPAQAMSAVVAGLSAMQAKGSDTASVLGDMGIKGTENLQVMLRLAGASDLLTSSLDLGAKAWSDNSALNAEFAKRNATTAAEMQRAMNAIKDSAINVGQVVAPIAADLANVLAALASGFSALPGPIQKLAVGALGLGVLSVGLIKVIGVARDARVAFQALQASSALSAQQFTTVATKAEASAGGITKAGRAAGIAAKAFGGLMVAGTAVAMMQDEMQALGSEQLISALGDGGDALSAINSELARVNAGDLGMFNAGINDLGGAIRNVFNAGAGAKADNALGSILGVVGVQNRSDIAEASTRLKELDATMAQLAGSGQGQAAAEMMSAISVEASKQGVSVEELAARFPAYAEALAAADNQAQAATGSQGEFTAALGETSISAEDAATQLSALLESITGLGNATSGARQTEADWQAAIDAATAAVAENGATVNRARTEIDLHTDAGRANDSALRGLAQTTLDYAANVFEMTGSVDQAAARVNSGREAFLSQARAMGMSSGAANKYADQLGLIPDTVRTIISVNSSGAAAQIRTVEQLLSRINGRTVTTRVITEYSSTGSRSTVGGQIKEDGGIVTAYEAGGFASSGRYVERASRIERGGANILWAEPVTGWEAYISGKPSQRNRNQAILADVAARFGGRYTPAEDGRGASGAAGAVGVSPGQFQALLGAVRDALGGLSVEADGERIARLVDRRKRALVGI